MNRISLSVALLDRILGLLAQRPYAEVAPLIQAIQKDVVPLPAPVVPNAQVSAVLHELN